MAFIKTLSLLFVFTVVAIQPSLSIRRMMYVLRQTRDTLDWKKMEVPEGTTDLYAQAVVASFIGNFDDGSRTFTIDWSTLQFVEVAKNVGTTEEKSNKLKLAMQSNGSATIFNTAEYVGTVANAPLPLLRDLMAQTNLPARREEQCYAVMSSDARDQMWLETLGIWLTFAVTYPDSADGGEGSSAPQPGPKRKEGKMKRLYARLNELSSSFRGSFTGLRSSMKKGGSSALSEPTEIFHFRALTLPDNLYIPNDNRQSGV